MSRIGREPISLPNGVRVEMKERSVAVTGPKGELTFALPVGIDIEVTDGTLAVRQSASHRGTTALWGTTRAILAHMVEGVEKGFEKKLEIHGVGYRANVEGSTIVLAVGFSHPVRIEAPEGITFGVDKNIVTVSGIDKAKVGETAAVIRKVRPPEPYKGKGIRYMGEHVRRKAGKKAATAA